MKEKLVVTAVAVSLLIVSLSVQAQPAKPVLKDALRLTGGKVVVCNLLSVSTSQIVVQTATGNKTYPRKKIAAILLGTSAASGNTATSGGASCKLYDLKVTGIGDKKINVIKVVRAHTGMSLAEAKAFVEQTPKTLMKGIGNSKADTVRAELEEAGATVAVTCTQ